MTLLVFLEQHEQAFSPGSLGVLTKAAALDVDVAAQTMNGFAFIERVTGAPILAQSVAFLDCAVRDRLEAGHHTFFAGEVLDCGFLADEETPILRMEDTRMNYGG